jgi:hypothetical protein
VSGCPSCGLYLSHVVGCRGVIAVYMRYMNRYEEDGFHSVEAAERFLAHGEDSGSLASVSVELGDGTVLRSRDVLGYEWPSL